MCRRLSHHPHPNKEVAGSCKCPYGDAKDGYLCCKIMYAIHQDTYIVFDYQSCNLSRSIQLYGRWSATTSSPWQRRPETDIIHHNWQWYQAIASSIAGLVGIKWGIPMTVPIWHTMLWCNTEDHITHKTPWCITIDSRYIAFQYNSILLISRQWQSQNIQQIWNPQKAPPTSPWRARHGVTFVNTWGRKMYCDISRARCSLSLVTSISAKPC